MDTNEFRAEQAIAEALMAAIAKLGYFYDRAAGYDPGIGWASGGGDCRMHVSFKITYRTHGNEVPAPLPPKEMT